MEVGSAGAVRAETIPGAVGMSQIAIEPVLTWERETTEAMIHRYMAQHRATYIDYARAISPNLIRYQEIWDRFAFAILTANTTVPRAVSAFHFMRDGGLFEPKQLAGVTPDRVDFVRMLPRAQDGLMALLKHRSEGWTEYRDRIVRDVPGLAMTKASYAVCLLYPLRAEVACVDVWVQKLYFGYNTVFQSLTSDAYRQVEEWLGRYAIRHRVCLGLCQWMLWDFVRGRRPTRQDFFRRNVRA